MRPTTDLIAGDTLPRLRDAGTAVRSNRNRHRKAGPARRRCLRNNGRSKTVSARKTPPQKRRPKMTPHRVRHSPAVASRLRIRPVEQKYLQTCRIPSARDRSSPRIASEVSAPLTSSPSFSSPTLSTLSSSAPCRDWRAATGRHGNVAVVRGKAHRHSIAAFQPPAIGDRGDRAGKPAVHHAASGFRSSGTLGISPAPNVARLTSIRSSAKRTGTSKRNPAVIDCAGCRRGFELDDAAFGNVQPVAATPFTATDNSALLRARYPPDLARHRHSF